MLCWECSVQISDDPYQRLIACADVSKAIEVYIMQLLSKELCLCRLNADRPPAAPRTGLAPLQVKHPITSLFSIVVNACKSFLSTLTSKDIDCTIILLVLIYCIVSNGFKT